MKITREEAYEILEVEEDAEEDEIRKSYRKKSLQWHPDKHPEENRAAATAEFQRIGAAYTKLTQDESDDEDFDLDPEDLEEFFEDLFAELFGAFGGHYGFGGGPGVRFSTGDFHHEFGGGGGSRGGYNRGHGSRNQRGRYSEPRRNAEYYRQRQAEEQARKVRQQERDQAEEQAQRVRFKAEQDRIAREEAEQRAKWLQKLGCLTSISFTDTSVKLRADLTGILTADFSSRIYFPSGCYWELQYKPDADKEDYLWIITVKDTLDVEVTGLQPRTQYLFRSRTCARLPDSVIQYGEWSEEYTAATSGAGASKKASGGSGKAATPAAAAGNGNGNSGGGRSKKAQKRAEKKKKAAAEMKKQQQKNKLDKEAAAANSKAAAEKEQKDKLKAAMEAAAADHAAFNAANNIAAVIMALVVLMVMLLMPRQSVKQH